MLDQPLVPELLSDLSTLPFSPRLRLPVRTARELVVSTAWVSEYAPAEKVYRMFGQDPRLPGLAILREERPVGVVFRSTLIERFSYRYSHELFGPKPITAFMETGPLMVEASCDIDEIGRNFLGGTLPRSMEDGFLVLEGGRFAGIGTWQSLMKCLSGRREELFSYMAQHDPLTGLPNRIRFMGALEQELEKGRPGAIFYIDLDRFKEVNDRFGHQEGDRLLNLFADRLSLSVREEDLVARLGGDEFGVLVRGLSRASDLGHWIAQFRACLKEPCLIGGLPFEILASVGSCLYPQEGMGQTLLLRQADSAMYADKQLRKNLPEGVPGEKRRRVGEAGGKKAPGEPEETLSRDGPAEDPGHTMDTLTGLADRTAFYRAFSSAVAQQKARKEGCLLLLVMDLDRFQALNDISGHTLGDRILRAVSERLVSIVRRGDPVFRMGGDEFAMICSGVASRNAAEKVAAEILHAVSKPYLIDGQEFFLTASIGATLHPEDGEDFEGLISNADLALSESKERGRFQVQFYCAGDRTRQIARYSLEKRLYKALEKNQFRLYYQPVLDMATGRTEGAEALIRWISEEGTVVAPDQFIPLAEENGMIVPIGQWVLRTALEQLAVWRNAGLGHLRIAINLSARQMQEPDFLGSFLQILDRSGEDPGRVVLEMTETVIMKKAEESIEMLGILKSRNIRIAIDDFGTGYSSLGYLRRFPVDVIKIDRSFIRRIGELGENTEIVRLITLLSRTLGVTTCAEGVETLSEHGVLKELGVESYQGYLASPAIPSEEFMAWVRARRGSSPLCPVDRSSN